jgi:hypothetical protein
MMVRFADYLLTVETLIEGSKDYITMFNDFIADNVQAKQAVDKYINWARQNLKKNDRIVWFLRWARVELAGRAKHTDSDTELQRLNKRLGTDFSRHDLVPINNLMTNLVHYLGMPIPQLQTIIWQKQSPNELLEQMSAIESDWKEANASNNNLLQYSAGDEPEKVMSFPDGYAWFDLERPYCSREAAAMGHCGNQGGQGTILSLRRLAKAQDGMTHWYPVCTFILHSDGYLGEMKGRNNDKPIEKYHPYIIALLKSPQIEGIRGGGYLPEHNFTMSDLDDDVAKELKALKPGLADIDDLYRTEGMTPRVISLIDHRLPSGLGTGTYDSADEAFIVETWKDLNHFLSHGVYDDNVEKIFDIAVGEADFQADRSKAAPDEFIDTVLNMPVQWQERIVTRAGIIKPPKGEVDHIIMDAAKRLVETDDDWYRLFKEVYGNEDRIREEAWERLTQYVDVGWSFASMQVYLNIPSDEAALRAFVENGTEVQLRCSAQAMVNYAMASDDDEDEAGWEIRQMQGDSSDASWETVDSENTTERRREEGLLTGGYGHNRNDEPWLAGLDTDTKSLVTDFLDVLQGNPIPGRIIDPRQDELKFESINLRRLLQLSGMVVPVRLELTPFALGPRHSTTELRNLIT